MKHETSSPRWHPVTTNIPQFAPRVLEQNDHVRVPRPSHINSRYRTNASRSYIPQYLNAYPLSKTFFAASTTFFTSPLPFSTTFSIAVPAFLSSSGLAVLFNCIPRSFFCCLLRASLIVVAALSPALAASATAALRESAVGGGILITRSKGLAPVGSGWDVSERVEAWMAEETGLTCCER